MLLSCLQVLLGLQLCFLDDTVQSGCGWVELQGGLRGFQLQKEREN